MEKEHVTRHDKVARELCSGDVARLRPDAWCELRAVLEQGFAACRSADRVDDAIQDAVLALLIALHAGNVIVDPASWCAVVVRRRLVDAHRRARRLVLGRELDDVECLAEHVSDWAARLQAEGIKLSTADCELLRCIQAGCRGRGSLAKALGRNEKTIKQRRARLQALL